MNQCFSFASVKRHCLITVCLNIPGCHTVLALILEESKVNRRGRRSNCISFRTCVAYRLTQCSTKVCTWKLWKWLEKEWNNWNECISITLHTFYTTISLLHFIHCQAERLCIQTILEAMTQVTFCSVERCRQSLPCIENMSIISDRDPASRICYHWRNVKRNCFQFSDSEDYQYGREPLFRNFTSITGKTGEVQLMQAFQVCTRNVLKLYFAVILKLDPLTFQAISSFLKCKQKRLRYEFSN